jgi:hypothetical protein
MSYIHLNLKFAVVKLLSMEYIYLFAVAILEYLDLADLLEPLFPKTHLQRFKFPKTHQNGFLGMFKQSIRIEIGGRRIVSRGSSHKGNYTPLEPSEVVAMESRIPYRRVRFD